MLSSITFPKSIIEKLKTLIVSTWSDEISAIAFKLHLRYHNDLYRMTYVTACLLHIDDKWYISNACDIVMWTEEYTVMALQYFTRRHQQKLLLCLRYCYCRQLAAVFQINMRSQIFIMLWNQDKYWQTLIDLICFECLVGFRKWHSIRLFP